MKNIIPIIIAVILGFVAVFIVSKTISKTNGKIDETVEIVAASRALSPNETIVEAFIRPRRVVKSSLPIQHIKWVDRPMLIGQKVLRAIPKDDYVMLSDVGLTRSMGNVIGDGEWGVPVVFSNSALISMLQPGDEIAIVGTFNVVKQVKSNKNVDATPKTIRQNVTSVIFPRVRILEINGNSVLFSLPPQQAVALTAIQRKAELYPLLRKTNDTKALNRKDGGVFEDAALSAMLEGLNPIEIPSVPTEN